MTPKTRLFRGVGVAALLLTLSAAAFPPALRAQNEDTEAEEIPCEADALRAAIESTTIEAITFPDDCTLTLSADLPPVSKPFAIEGGGAIIDGAGDFRPFHVVEGGELSISGLTIRNSSSPFGGAFYVTGGTLTLDEVVVRNNSALGVFGGGALLVTGGEVSLNGSTLYQNFSLTEGGAVAVYAGRFEAVNSTFGENTAQNGGAISIGGGEVDLRSSTLTTNLATQGGGAISKGVPGALTLGQNIIVGNSAQFGNDVRVLSGLTSEGYNLFGGTDFVGPVEFASTDLFAPNAFLGMFSGTVYPIGSESPALDAIPEGVCDNEADGRLTERPQGEGCDIGAVEMEQTGETVEIGEQDYPELVEIAAAEQPECTIGLNAGVNSINFPENVFCRTLMRNGGWVANPGSVPQDVIDRGVILAIEVFSMTGGQALNELAEPLPVCLRGEGQLVYLDATASPRVTTEVASVEAGGYTCTFVPRPGTVALVQR
ncbi:MAG: choice-of-anchor Q domain-containing protein [bacterium]|nr:choice-of-anchor Q domain-containing protein [bacterium]